MSRENPFKFLRGYSFTFTEADVEIKVWFSILTGAERVYANGHLVSSTRSLSKNSIIEFEFLESSYTINIGAENISKGPVICTLSKNGNLCKRQKMKFSNTLKLWQGLSIIFGGFIIGFVASLTNIPKAFFHAAIVVYFLLIVYLAYNTKKPIIVEENV